jgi:O-glycosyl hydrolase
MYRISNLLLFIVLLAVVGCKKNSSIPATKLSISPTPSHTLKGWGIFPCTIQNDRPNAQNFTIFKRPNAQKLIFGELGMSFMRCEILPGSYDEKKDNGSLDTKYLDESLVQQMNIAKRFGINKTSLSVWSPPAIFKDPPTTFGTDPKSKRVAHLKQSRELDYCRYIVRVFDYLTKTKKLTVPFAFSIQNEPNFAAGEWKGNQYAPAQWQRVFKLMRRELDNGGYKSVQLIGPEGGGYVESVQFIGGKEAPSLKNDKEFRDAMAGFAFHGYSITSKKVEYSENLQNVAKIAASYKKDIWMSEFSLIAQKPKPLEHAIITSTRLAREMTYIPSNYWCWWQGWYPVHPKNEVLLTGIDDNALHISKTYYVLKKLWHSAPAGSVVHQIKSNDEEIKGYDPLEVQTVAFEYKNRTTVLVINPTDESKSLNISGLSGRTATPFLTDATQDMKAQATIKLVNTTAETILPKQSIMILTSD